ncbi:Glycosyl hydrolase family 32 N-terminal domain-containing protein [Candidatus Electrothrix laxa]
MQSHAAVPFADKLEGDVYRVYFTTRDNKNQAHTAFIDINILNPHEILGMSKTPVLTPGLLGGFDDSGAMGCWLTKENGTSYLYYQGWNLGVTVPFRNSIGLALSNGNSNFRCYSPGPILDRSMFEPHFTATPCVIVEHGKWKMWYLSCTEWTMENGFPKHKYHIKYAESEDGIHWQRDGVIAIDYANDKEFAISRPSVTHDNDCWKMWYSFRGQSYRIGYAESEDGRQWKRLDSQAGIDVSPTDWDSEMIEYPFVFDHKGQRYMLYNGNGYGKTGFGLAVLEQS